MSKLPASYKAAAIKEAGGKFEIVDVKPKEPQAGHLVAKVLASGLCASDHIVVDGVMPVGYPRVPGHEIIGNVVAVHPDEKRFKVGDRIGSGWHGGHCNQCKSCVRGDFVTCENENINGILTDGGHAEYVTLRTEAVCFISTEIDPVEAAPLMCAGVTTFNSMRNVKGLLPGDIVAVSGLGGLGHLALQFAAKAGYKVVALSSSADKKDFAMKLGAHEYLYGDNVVEQLQKMGGAKAIICTASSGKLISSLIPALAVGGTAVLLALADDLSIPAMPMIQKRLSLAGHPSGTAQDSAETVEFARLHGVKCQVEKFKLEDIQKAYERMRSNDMRFRGVIVFDQ